MKKNITKHFKRRAKSLSVVLALILVLFATGCKKLIEIDSPIESIVGKEIYNSNAGASSVLTGIYMTMAGGGSFVQGINGISICLGLSADELVLFGGSADLNLVNFYQNAASDKVGNFFWNSLYESIFRANSAIEGISASKELSDNVRQQLLGEAYFLRAFYYFYLVNMYGDVPLLLSTDTRVSLVAPRVDKSLVYQQIEKDLTDAQVMLNDNYVEGDAVTTTSERVRPNRSVATALLARVYLYLGEWQKAESQATLIIESGNYSLGPLDEVFLKNSSETIWALESRNLYSDNADGIIFNFLDTDNGPSGGHPVYITDLLWNSFESGDNRKNEWAKTKISDSQTYPYPNKYKTNILSTEVTEYQMVFRLAEQYFIRAEARAYQGKLTGPGSAESDINAIRNRAGLANINESTQSGLVDAIGRERRIELFTEWGDRWFDAKRRNVIDGVMNTIAPSKGINWMSFKSLFPINVDEIKNNPGLRGHQNPGYPAS